MAGVKPPDELLRLRIEVQALTTALREAERRNALWEEERRHCIPVEEVHRRLGTFNLPRRSPHGWSYVLAERFALLKVRMEMESR
jgi:hypothetical protein